MDRHGRQSRLAEVGSAGQAKIARASVDVPLDGFAAEVAGGYLVGAGARRVRVRDSALAATLRAMDPSVRVEVALDIAFEPSPGPFGFRDPAAQALADGAHFALRTVRALLEGVP
ncbi:MAG: hypothetical protein ABSF69_02010 [Polyangiaceae bacterium]|jgi:hypothetical protein